MHTPLVDEHPETAMHRALPKLALPQQLGLQRIIDQIADNDPFGYIFHWNRKLGNPGNMPTEVVLIKTSASDNASLA